MLETGFVMELPGMRSVITSPPLNLAQDPMVMEITLDPGSGGGPAHYHPTLEEEYRVRRGTLNVLIDRAWRDVQEGGSVVVPARTRHAFRNTSRESVVMLNIHRPAGDFAAFWEEAGALARTARPTSMNSPRTVMLMSMLIMEHPTALVPTGFLGRVVMPTAAWLGRRLGMDRTVAKASAAATPDRP